MRNNFARLRGGDPRWADTGALGDVARAEFFGTEAPSRQKMWNGTAFVTGVLKVWTGTAWRSTLRRWNGSAWVNV